MELVVENFVEKYGEGRRAWKMLKEEVESIGRSEEEEEKDGPGFYITATAKVHLVVKDEVVIGSFALEGSKNLWKVTATRASRVRHKAFWYCENLI